MKKKAKKTKRPNLTSTKYDPAKAHRATTYSIWVSEYVPHDEGISNEDDLLYKLCVSLAWDMTFSYNSIVKTVRNTRSANIVQNTVNLRDSQWRGYDWQITLPHKTATLLKKVVALDSLPTSITELRSRINAIEAKYIKTYKSSFSNKLPVKLTQIYKSSLVLNKKYPNWIVNNLSRWPGPSVPSCEYRRGINQNHEQLSDILVAEARKKELQKPTKYISITSYSQLYLHKLYNQLFKDLKDQEEKLHPEQRKRSSNYLHRLDEIRKSIESDSYCSPKEGYPKTTALLVVNWFSWALSERPENKKPMRLSSAKTYAATVFNNFIFDYEDCDTFLQWSYEVISERIEISIGARIHSYEPKTTKNKISHFLCLFEYLKKENKIKLPRIRMFYENDDYYCSTRRSVIYPHQFSEVLSFVYNAFTSDEYLRDMFCAILVMGYYSGIRPSEILELPLSGLSDDLIITITIGKSKSARRELPLKLLVPEEHQKYIETYLESRKRQFPRLKRFKNIALFGDYEDKEFCKYWKIITPLNTLFKSFFGDEFSFYTLRHSFASWALLRYHLIQDEGFYNYIPDGDHIMYSQKSIAAFSQLFDPGDNDHIMTLAKLQGHFGIETLLKHYWHTFHIVQKYMVEKHDTS